MELTANELRIGNLVNALLYGDEPINIESICSLNNEIFNSITGEIPLISIKPIPITEEWLLKFGFAKEQVTVNDIIINIYRLGDYEISIYLQGNETQKGYYLPHSLQSRAYIKYVHQLQNLYFSLINTELKLK